MFAADSSGSAVFIIVAVVVAIIHIIGLWVVFTKAAQPGWTAIIPILNTLVLLRVVKRPLWWIILLIIPIVNIVVLIIVWYDLAKAFGHGGGYTVGLVFLPVIFLLILAFSDDTYRLEPDPLF